MVSYQEVDCIGFQGYRASNDTVELVVAPEIGGRIMGFGPIGCNLLFVNESLRGIKPRRGNGSTETWADFRRAQGFMLYGGEKTWLAPQEDWEGPPYAELDHGAYRFQLRNDERGAQITMTSPVCSETGIQLVRTISVPAHGSTVCIRQRAVNLGDSPVTKGLWQVIMLNRPGQVVFPTDKNSVYKQGIRYFDPNQEGRLPIVHQGTEIRIDCVDDKKFKIGTDSNEGWVRTWIPGQEGQSTALDVRFPVSAGPYGHGCAVEVFNSPLYPYFEVETHGPLTLLHPGDEMENEVHWSVEFAQLQ